ncbi:MAG: family acetyltransferase [Herbinix sp.]|jgi:mycothiol synthase|nr:family acetyltransferase [Herbinix sp.]
MKNKFMIRAPRQEEAEAVYQLVIACDIEDFGAPDFDLQELLDLWSGFDMNNNVWIVENEDHHLVGYAFLEEDSEDKLFSYGFVLPSARGTGVGTLLLEAIEERAQMLANSSGITKRLQNLIPTQRDDAQNLLRKQGFDPVRFYKRMRIKMEEAPSEPILPDGMIITNFVPNQDEKFVYDAYVEAFADHWDFAAPVYEAWIEKTKLPSFRPEWWFLARNQQGDIVGVALARMNEDTLYVNQIGVRRSYRGRGLGLALLRQVLHTSYAAGQPIISLGVDAANLSGAYRLYEKVGMRAIHETTLCEKTIHA